MEINSNAGNDFMKLYYEISDRCDKKLAVWISDLRNIGISAAIPDDGWIDRSNNCFQIIKPHFNIGIKIGSIVAIGCPEEFRVVVITKIDKTKFMGIIKYYFDELTIDTLNKSTIEMFIKSMALNFSVDVNNS